MLTPKDLCSHNRCVRTKTILVLSLAIGIVCLSSPLVFAADASLSDKAKNAAQKTSDAVKEAGNSAADKIKDLWGRIDSARLQNRTRDEVVAWVIMGVLVGALAGTMTSLKPTGIGRAGRLLWGLGGAFIGGMIVHVAKLDFGWGPVLIRYEELLFAFLGAVILLVLTRFLRSKSSKTPSPQGK